MQYERRSISQSEEKDIIIGMIISSDFIKQIQDTYKSEYFTLPYTRLVSRWCMDYYEKYDKAPFRDVKSIFESKKATIYDEATVEMIDTFLGNLSMRFEEDPKKYNTDYNVDKAVQYFKWKSIDLLTERIQAARLNNDHAQAEHEIAGYKRVEKLQHGGVDVWTDVSAHIRALNGQLDDTSLIHFPGAWGELVRPFRRQDFVVVVGPAKRKKSLWMQEVALMASFNKYNVLYFSLEMTEDQMLSRIQQRIMATLSSDIDEAEVIIPMFDSNYNMNGVIHHRKSRQYCMSIQDVVRRIGSVRTLTKSKNFRLMCPPAGSMKASDISIHLDNFEHYDNFVPDVICVDYPDILAPERNNEKRHQIDETWKILRSISQEKNCLMVVVSHTNKATFDRDIRQGDLSEDSRKLNHVTWAGALNQNDDDIENNVMRFSVLIDRFKQFNPKKEVVILQCLDIGQFYIDSRILFNNKEAK